MDDLFDFENNVTFEMLNPEIHERNNFECGILELNTYIMKYANQQQTKNLNKVYVATSKTQTIPKSIFGYYTLSSNSLSFASFPDGILKNIPQEYPIPTIKIGRLARDMNTTPRGFGNVILGDALFRALKFSKELGVLAVDVDAKNNKAKEFYKRNEFIPLRDQPAVLIIPIKTLAKVFLNKNVRPEKQEIIYS